MGNFKVLMALGLGALLLAGCEGMQLGEAKKASPTGSDFSKALYGEYVKLSEGEYNEGDYRDSDVFAMGAIKAAGNSPGEPEEISSRALPGDKVSELTTSRERLMKALAAGAREKMPAQAANAQAMFDCWMQEQEENFQPKDIAKCRGDLMAKLDEIEAAMRPTPVAAAAPAPAPEPMMKRFEVFFPFDRADLTPEAAATVRDAIDAAKGGARVRMVGNADTMGPASYNMGLSDRRVGSVVDAFKQGGMPPTDMDLNALGETNLPVPTADEVAEQGNRRVEIVISK